MPYGGTSGVMTQIRDEFDRMFDRFSRHWPGMGLLRGNESPWHWDLEVREEDKAIAVRADLPGFAASDIDLQVTDDRFTIRAAHKSEVDEKDKGWTRQRREYFQTVPLPSAVDAEKIDAHFRNGVLTVRLPKTERAAGRRVAIREGKPGTSRPSPKGGSRDDRSRHRVAGVTITLNEEERAELLKFLEQAYREAHRRSAPNRSLDFKEYVRHKEAILKGLIDKLRRP